MQRVYLGFLRGPNKESLNDFECILECVLESATCLRIERFLRVRRNKGHEPETNRLFLRDPVDFQQNIYGQLERLPFRHLPKRHSGETYTHDDFAYTLMLPRICMATVEHLGFFGETF
jgi:hypothetical protein